MSHSPALCWQFSCTTVGQFAFPPTPLSIAILELLVARMAEVLVKESSHAVLSLAAECIGSLKLGALPAAPEMALSLKSFMAQEMHGCMTCTVAALSWQLLSLLQFLLGT